MVESASYLVGQAINEQDYTLDFMYSQIKKLGDQLDAYSGETGNFQESDSMLRAFIIEKKSKEGFPLFRNKKISIFAVDFEENDDKPLILEIKILSPIMNGKMNWGARRGESSSDERGCPGGDDILEQSDKGNTIKKGFRLNSLEIKEFIKETCDNIELQEFAINNNYDINYKNIVKRIAFHEGTEEIALIRAEILKLSENNKILDIQLINPDEYKIISKDVSFNIVINSKYLIIQGNLEDIIEIHKIFPLVQDIITNNKEILGVGKAQIIKKKSAKGIKELFGFGKKEKEKDMKSVTKISDQSLDSALAFIKKNSEILADFKTNLENGFLSDLEKFDKDIKEDIKEISIEFITEILELVEKTTLDNPKLILYTTYLIRIFLNAVAKNKLPNNKLTTFYKYILGRENLRKKYGEKIKAKILESQEYKGEICSEILSVLTSNQTKSSNYKTNIEGKHDMIFDEDSMQLITTNSAYNLLSYNISLGIIKTILYKTDFYYKSISRNGRYLYYKQEKLLSREYSLRDLEKNKKTEIERIFRYDDKSKHILYKDYIIHIGYIDSNQYFAIYNIKTKDIVNPKINIYKDIYCVSQNKFFFFEATNDGSFSSLNSQDLGKGQTKSLNYLFEHGDVPMDIYSTDEHLYIALKDKRNRLILRRLNIENGEIIHNSISNYDISHLQHVFQKGYIHISNYGYALLQSNDYIYIFNLNDNLEKEEKVNSREDKESEDTTLKSNFKIYRIKSSKAIHHIFKVEFVNSPQYGHFAICRDGNQIHKIDIGLLEELEDPISIKENMILEIKNDKGIDKSEISGNNELYKKIEAKLEESEKRDVLILEKLANSETHNAKTLEQLKRSEANNAMILKQLEESNKINASMTETINQLKEILSEKK